MSGILCLHFGNTIAQMVRSIRMFIRGNVSRINYTILMHCWYVCLTLSFIAQNIAVMSRVENVMVEATNSLFF